MTPSGLTFSIVNVLQQVWFVGWRVEVATTDTKQMLASLKFRKKSSTILQKY